MATFALLTSSPDEIVTIVAKKPLMAILLMMGMGVFTSALPYFLYTLGLKNLQAGTASSLGVIEPLAATLYDILLFDAKFDFYNVFGVVLIVSAVIILSCTE